MLTTTQADWTAVDKYDALINALTYKSGSFQVSGVSIDLDEDDYFELVDCIFRNLLRETLPKESRPARWRDIDKYSFEINLNWDLLNQDAWHQFRYTRLVPMPHTDGRCYLEDINTIHVAIKTAVYTAGSMWHRKQPSDNCPAGPWPRRLQKLLKRTLPDIDWSRVIPGAGQFASTMLVREGEELTFEIRNTVDWNQGDYGDSGSCYWGAYHRSPDVIAECRDTFAIAVTNKQGRGVSRCWGAYIPGEYVVLTNAYGKLSTKAYAEILADILNAVTCRGDIENSQGASPYINSDARGIAIGERYRDRAEKNMGVYYDMHTTVQGECPDCRMDEDECDCETCCGCYERVNTQYDHFCRECDCCDNCCERCRNCDGHEGFCDSCDRCHECGESR